MKTVSAAMMLVLFLFAGQAAAVDLNGTWAGVLSCSDGHEEDFEVDITQDGDFFTIYNAAQGETCGGVIEGNTIQMSCPNVVEHIGISIPGVLDTSIPVEQRASSFATGVIKGHTIHIINHVPNDGLTCKGVAFLVD